MKYFKVLFCLICTLSILVGCTNTKPSIEEQIVYSNAYASIDPLEIKTISSLLEYSFNITDSQAMMVKSEYIVLATITSIDGGSNENESTNQRISFPYTYGKLEIINVYQGDLEPNQEINYTRSGGIIPYEEYSLSLEERHKPTQAQIECQLPYVKYIAEDAIEIEVGTTYLIYLSLNKENPLRKNAYSIVGWGGGLKEVRNIGNSSVKESTPTSEIEVFNNFNQTWEPLSQFIFNANP